MDVYIHKIEKIVILKKHIRKENGDCHHYCYMELQVVSKDSDGNEIRETINLFSDNQEKLNILDKTKWIEM